MNPNYPVYIVSKGRWESRLTSKVFDRINVPYHIVVEPQEYDQYAAVIDRAKILVLPKKYQDNYDTFDDLGDTKSTGPGAARNFAWEHSIEQGAERHWVLDDNIRQFFRLNRNKKYKIHSGTIFKAAEDFVNRYTNIALAGFQYEMFVPRKQKRKPFALNTRIYSCILIKNNLDFRWRGRYNEDTDLSLRVLKSGLCTVLFSAFLCFKIATQTMKGGNTSEFYDYEGTLPKSKMLVAMHPDATTLVRRWNRWHHKVNYRPFKNNRPILRDDIEIETGVNNYGMILVD